MELLQLPPDMIKEILYNLCPTDMISWCTSHKESLCSDNIFLTTFVRKNYSELDFNSIEYLGSNWDKFLFIENLVKRLKRWNIGEIYSYKIEPGGLICARSASLINIYHDAAKARNFSLIKHLTNILSNYINDSVFRRYNHVFSHYTDRIKFINDLLLEPFFEILMLDDGCDLYCDVIDNIVIM